MRGGVLVCGLYGWEVCTNTLLSGNIVAGAYYAGFAAPAHECDSGDEVTFYNNVAHSNEGVGAFVYPDINNDEHLTCYEVSYFYAYKNTYEGLVSYFPG